MPDSVKNCIGYSWSARGRRQFFSFNPRKNKYNDFPVYFATEHEVEKALSLAENAFNKFALTTFRQRADFLKRIASQLILQNEELLKLFVLESGLSPLRAKNEFDRTLHQLNLFSDALITGQLMKFNSEPLLQKDGEVLPELTKIWVPIGPVLVFGASNFPLAYSTIGGDVVAAFAAGCPVIVKGHPMHPGTSQIVAECIMKAAVSLGLPEGVFSCLNLKTGPVVDCLISHKTIKAIGFTGSFSAGSYINRKAQQRDEPIPVFAEMGSVNPVVFLPGMLENKLEYWSKRLSQAVTNDAGQFCTKPGLIFIPENGVGDRFLSSFLKDVLSSMPHPLLHPDIKVRYVNRIREFQNLKLGKCHGEIPSKETCFASGLIWEFLSTDFLANAISHDEVFGPFSVVVRYKSSHDLYECVHLLKGQLTASLIGEERELYAHSNLLNQLSRKAGRIIVNGLPTGLRVVDAMHHGGPFPATTDSRFSAVGTDSVLRFCRPLCIQTSHPEQKRWSVDQFSY
jgi:alpha-ketoglutaric semialdehyde dehydrogenase